MTTVASVRNSKFDTTRGSALIAPEWSEYVSERLFLNLWSCTNCGFRFDTEAHMPADAEPRVDSKVLEEFFASLLVA